jgi:hypothetical protein
VESHQQTQWTTQEEAIILEKYQEFGSKWVMIAGFLCGRTGNDVKNRWHKHISKRLIAHNEGTQKTDSPELEEEISPTVAEPKPLSTFLEFVLN